MAEKSAVESTDKKKGTAIPKGHVRLKLNKRAGSHYDVKSSRQWSNQENISPNIPGEHASVNDAPAELAETLLGLTFTHQPHNTPDGQFKTLPKFAILGFGDGVGEEDQHKLQMILAGVKNAAMGAAPSDD